MAELRFAFCLDREHLAGVIENGGRGVFFRARPSGVGERTERRRFFADSDVARNEIRLLERDVEFRFVRKLESENFLAAVARAGRFHELEEASNAMLEMDDEIAFH